MNTKKGLINPVLHEIRSPNPPSTRVSGLKYQNDYPKSIERMAGVGYNRNSNDLRELNQQATTTAIGARSNPDYSTHRFTGLYGREALNQPQKYTSAFDSKMKQKIELLRHGNENRRFGKRKTMKKSSYENGIAGGGYSGEIIVTPKRGRPYKGQPNSLPLVSKRQKIKKDDWYNPPPNPKKEEKLNPFFESPEYKTAKELFGQVVAGGLLSNFGPYGFALFMRDFASSPENAQRIGNIAENLTSLGTSPFNAIMTPEILSTLSKWLPKNVALKDAAKIGARASKIIGPAQTAYGYGSSVKNLLDAMSKEDDYQNGIPSFNTSIAQNEANQPIKRFDAFGGATNNVEGDMIPEDFLFNWEDKYRDPAIIAMNALGYGPSKGLGPVGNLYDAYNAYQNVKNPKNSMMSGPVKYNNLEPISIYDQINLLPNDALFDVNTQKILASLTKEQRELAQKDPTILHDIAQKVPVEKETTNPLDAYLQSLTPAQRDEFGRFGNPTTMRRKTINPIDALTESFITQYLGSGNVTPMWSNHANNTLFDQVDTVFGDVGSTRGLGEAPQYYIEGYTPQGIKRKTGVSYVNQPDGKNMPMYDLSKKPTTQSSHIPLFEQGLPIASKYLNQIQSGKMPDFSPVKDAHLINSVDTEDPGWYAGAQLTKPLPQVKLNAMDSFTNWVNSFNKRDTKKSATFTKSLYPTKDKYDNTEKTVAKLVNPSKNTNKYFK